MICMRYIEDLRCSGPQGPLAVARDTAHALALEAPELRARVLGGRGHQLAVRGEGRVACSARQRLHEVNQLFKPLCIYPICIYPTYTCISYILSLMYIYNLYIS